MDIQKTAKRLLEGAEDMAKSPATTVKFPQSAGTAKHTSSEKLNGSTQGMPSEDEGANTFNANVAAKVGERPDDEKMPGKKAGKLRKKDSMTDAESEIDAKIDYLSDNPGKQASAGVGKTTKLTKEENETDEEIVVEDANEVEEELSLDHHLTALFNGQELTEDFKTRTATIFKAAVNERVLAITEKLEASVESRLAAAIQENKEEMANNLDSYLSYVVEEWMKENQVAIERGLRNEITEEFLTGLRNLFLEHNIDVPESKVDVLEKMAARIEELEENLNKEIENNISLREKVEVATKRDVVEEVGSDLTTSEKIKLRKLAEGIESESREDFVSKVKILKENYFAEAIEPTNNSTVEEVEELQPNYLTENNGSMSEYLKALNRLNRSK